MIISPSILSADFMNLQNDIEALALRDDIWLHLDVMDGHFVPNMTFGIPIIKQLSTITKIPLDMHLMVTNPEFHIHELKNTKLQNVTFHIEAVEDALHLIKIAKQFFPSVGISIKPGTDVGSLSTDILEAVDLILVMSVEPGFGGQKFMPKAVEKIVQLNYLREQNQYHFQIQVDGGIDNNTVKSVTDAGADNLVAGSYIFGAKQEDYNKRIDSLKI